MDQDADQDGGTPPGLGESDGEAKRRGRATGSNPGRFQPGRSGNPRGRPRGAKNHKTIIQEVAAERHWVKEGRKRRRRSTVELLLITIRNLALTGDLKAFRAMERCLARYGPIEPQQRGYLVVPEGCTSLEEAAAVAAELREWHQRLLGGDLDRDLS